MTVIDFNAAKEELAPHLSGPALCIDCHHEWTAVAPTGTVWLECPACGLQRGRFLYRAQRSDDPHWVCDCGCDLFHVIPDGVYCPNCGATQTGF